MKTDPYRPPQTSVADPSINTALKPHSNLLIISSWLVVFVFSVIAILVPLAISSFIDLFSGFGADLPALTKFVIHSRFFWGIFSIPALALAIYITVLPTHTRRYRRRMGLVLIMILVGIVLLIVMSIVAMYLPIFRIPKVVN